MEMVAGAARLRVEDLTFKVGWHQVLEDGLLRELERLVQMAKQLSEKVVHLPGFFDVESESR